MIFKLKRVAAYDGGGYNGCAIYDESAAKYYKAPIVSENKFKADVENFASAEKIELTQVGDNILLATSDAGEITVNVSFDTLTQNECSYLTGYNKPVFMATALDEFANK